MCVTRYDLNPTLYNYSRMTSCLHHPSLLRRVVNEEIERCNGHYYYFYFYTRTSQGLLHCVYYTHKQPNLCQFLVYSQQVL